MISSVSLGPLYQAECSSNGILLDEEAPRAIFSDTNDYESAPNFESSKEVPFGKFLQFGFGPSVR